MSNVRKTWSQNSSALPDGKNILYMSTNFAGVNLPLGQSCCNIRKRRDKIVNSLSCYIFSRVYEHFSAIPIYPSFFFHHFLPICINDKKYSKNIRFENLHSNKIMYAYI